MRLSGLWFKPCRCHRLLYYHYSRPILGHFSDTRTVRSNNASRVIDPMCDGYCEFDDMLRQNENWQCWLVVGLFNISLSNADVTEPRMRNLLLLYPAS
jgi:hypothetical protein